jgi:uncharacterized protein YndB with AHSA1/START domain
MTAANSAGLTVVPRADREIVMTRVFNAPRWLVFDALTRPELLVRWYGPHGWTVPVCEIDLRPGGAYHYVMRREDGSEISMRGLYREIARPDRLVVTERFDGFSEVGWRPEDDTVTTTILTEQDGKTLLTSTLLYPSKDVRDAALQLNQAWRGTAESYDRLEELLQKETP